ncbi:Oidioi.mRNA.OKI2018_I69.chr1.g783.t1.cds [Oikopleura dioica]|uniref:Oidioi.mRNA.OKI2018_I69.chr1.g783.t1.cds n=1 Tax=Oikopleura dioica TaxID=34765 RepID=A0ABN7SKY0_OIKDI|nr:Oidioi.mRNA.OKI2018_I69.chr1.g783.t1.cds [Oikopleura dioica]
MNFSFLLQFLTVLKANEIGQSSSWRNLCEKWPNGVSLNCARIKYQLRSGKPDPVFPQTSPINLERTLSGIKEIFNRVPVLPPRTNPFHWTTYEQ